MSGNKNFIRVIFDLPIDREFHYGVPFGLKEKVAPGKRVKVPFGKKILTGFIVGFADKPGIPGVKVKPILQVLDDIPLVDRKMLRLSRWISQYYFCPWGKALFESVPAAVKKGKPKRLKPAPSLTSAKAVAPDFVPTREQVQALKIISNILEKKEFRVMLLCGKPGSGKMTVCLEGIDYCLAGKRDVIVLVPEVSKASPIFKRFVERYGSLVGVLHSRLSRGEHYEEWQKVKKGETKIVIGTRSAIFSPVKNLGMVIIYEEHDDSYKQNDTPRYHAREVAIRRARMNNALVVLNSPTPSLETFYQTEIRKFEKVFLPGRIDKKPFPEVKVIDMSRELFRRKVISPPLEEVIRKKVEKGEQVILFLNRRGFATSLICRQCGFVLRCPDCSLPLVFHQENKIARCHYCNYSQKVPSVCPQCYSSYMRYGGLGTQKLEEIINKSFNDSRVIRMDSDSTHHKFDRLNILRTVETGKSNFLIGTQMAVEGLEFPGITLAGVISADINLNLPDFRSGEKTFRFLNRIISQMQKKEKKGAVIIQTFNPEHPAIQAAAKDDFIAFYQWELEFRKELGYPPFSHLANIIISGKDRSKVEKKSTRLFSTFKKFKAHRHIEILGPVASLYSKIKGKYRQQIVLKAKEARNLQVILKEVFKVFNAGHDINISVDVDPLNVL